MLTYIHRLIVIIRRLSQQIRVHQIDFIENYILLKLIVLNSGTAIFREK